MSEYMYVPMDDEGTYVKSELAPETKKQNVKTKKETNTRSKTASKSTPKPGKKTPDTGLYAYTEEQYEAFKNNIKFPTPVDIKVKLDEYVIGQDEAKEALSVAVCNHYIRLSDDTNTIRKSNILLIGPTGCGKTYLAQTIANIMDVPFASVDSTSLTPPGFKGFDPDTILSRLYEAADRDIKKAERGVIFLDEIDKKIMNTDDPYLDSANESVVHALLRMFEGNKITVYKGENKTSEDLEIDTTNILFICGGAFSHVYEDVRKKTGKNTIGFNIEKDNKNEEISVSITPEDLVEYGALPEFLGRIPVVVELNDLTEDDLVRILTEPKGSICKDYQRLFEILGIDLEFKKDALNEVAKQAIERKTGARGLKNIMEETLRSVMFYVPSIPYVTNCTITKDTLTTKKAIIKQTKPEKVVVKKEVVSEGKEQAVAEAVNYSEDDYQNARNLMYDNEWPDTRMKPKERYCARLARTFRDPRINFARIPKDYDLKSKIKEVPPQVKPDGDKEIITLPFFKLVSQVWGKRNELFDNDPFLMDLWDSYASLIYEAYVLERDIPKFKKKEQTLINPCLSDDLYKRLVIHIVDVMNTKVEKGYVSDTFKNIWHFLAEIKSGFTEFVSYMNNPAYDSSRIYIDIATCDEYSVYIHNLYINYGIGRLGEHDKKHA